MSCARFTVGSVVMSALIYAPVAAAEPTSGQQAAAEALFEQATQLVDAGRIAEGCEKFAASQELDPGLGTLLHLADCYDRSGRTASAWALFRDVQERSRRASQQDREHIADQRASQLETKLSRLELRVIPSRQAPGLQLRLSDAAVPKASWNAPLPVDPGSVRVEATAPGKQPWSTVLRVTPGPSNQVVELPELKALPNTPRHGARDSGEADTGGSSRRGIGFVTGGVGLVALAVGGFFGYRAYALNQDSKGQCRAGSPNACTPSGVGTRDRASDAARLSTIATTAGAVLVVGGTTLALTAPTPGSDKRAAAGILLRGTW
jgi:hypothetical protein